MKVLLTIILCLRSFSVLIEANILDSTRLNGTVSHIKGRVVYGKFAATDQFPFVTWMFIADGKGMGSVCGGTIISSKLVLSAAHCFNIVARIDSWYGGKDKEFLPNFRKGVSFAKHPLYGAGMQSEHDIAVVMMDRAAVITPIKLPTTVSDTNYFVGKAMTIAGWGTAENGDLSRYLKYTTMIGELQTKCNKFNNTNFICAKGVEKSSGGPGDSGGPLILNDVLVGVIAFGVNGYDGYTRVDRYLDWVATTPLKCI